MTNLMRYETARAALAEARGVDEVKEIHDRAEALRAYGRMANDTQLEMDAAEIRVRAERRLGILIAEQKASIGLHRGGRPRAETGTQSEPVSQPPAPPTLAEAGIDKKLSSRAQKVAQIPEARFEEAVANVRHKIGEQSGRVSLDIVRDNAKAEIKQAHHRKIQGGGVAHDLTVLAATGYRAGVILADPPWHFATRSEKGDGRSANQHYTTNPLDAIKALPVQALAAPDCVLLMWTLDWCPGAALDVMKAWGFEHKTTAFTWVKQNASGNGMFMGQGYWTRANPETCWLATRGSPLRLDAAIRQLLIAPIQEHSRKPDEIYSRIERLVGGPYLELYARHPRQGWMSWGNELPPPEVHDENQDRFEYDFNQEPREPSDLEMLQDGEASSEAGPQAEASLAGTGGETLAGHEGGSAADTAVTEQPGGGSTASRMQDEAAKLFDKRPRWQGSVDAPATVKPASEDVDLASAMPSFLRRSGEAPA